MRVKRGAPMGRITVEFEVANNDELGAVRRGLLPASQVNRLTIKGVVDSEATRLVLPQAVVKQLGLPLLGKSPVRYADHRKAERETTEVHLALLGREGTFTAIVGPKRRTALIGAIVLEDLDLLVDCKKQQVVPRDPRFPIHEIE